MNKYVTEHVNYVINPKYNVRVIDLSLIRSIICGRTRFHLDKWTIVSFRRKQLNPDATDQLWAETLLHFVCLTETQQEVWSSGHHFRIKVRCKRVEWSSSSSARTQTDRRTLTAAVTSCRLHVVVVCEWRLKNLLLVKDAKPRVCLDNQRSEMSHQQLIKLKFAVILLIRQIWKQFSSAHDVIDSS